MLASSISITDLERAMWLRSSTACRESGVNHGYSRLAGGQAINRSSELRPPRDADARWLAAMRAGMGRARRRSPGDLHWRELTQGQEHAPRRAGGIVHNRFHKSLRRGANSR